MALNTFTALTIFIGVLSLSWAAPITCDGLTPEDCRTLFEKKFGNEINVLYREHLEKNIQTYISAYNAILEDTTIDETSTKLLEEARNNLKEGLESLPSNADMLTMDEYYKYLMNNYPGNLTQKEQEKVHEIWRVKRILEIMLRNMTATKQRLIDLYSELYGELRPQDLEAYADYAELKENMETMLPAFGIPTAVAEKLKQFSLRASEE